MRLPFFKYQATGNDFVIFDNRDKQLSLTLKQIQAICDRKFGVGADGLMLIEPDGDLDFKLQYYNSDGSQSLCGNGSRAAVSFASSLGVVDRLTTFNAYDGPHEAELLRNGDVRLRMSDVKTVKKSGEDFFIHTGSPHYIRFVDEVENWPVYEEGRSIRYSEPYRPDGTNVNFVQILPDNTIFVRTYERGVENETLSCGTGVTAAAIAASFRGLNSPVKIKTLGGELSVEFKAGAAEQPGEIPGTFSDVYLAGPAKMVFKGELEL